MWPDERRVVQWVWSHCCTHRAGIAGVMASCIGVFGGGVVQLLECISGGREVSISLHMLVLMTGEEV